MSYENSAGIGVNNQYGVRNTGGAVGITNTDNNIGYLTIDLTGEMINSSFVPPIMFPKGAHPLRYMLRVDEVFVLTGTSPVVNIGSAGSVATNGITLTQTELQAVGTKVPASTGNGTWAVGSATGLTAAALVAYALGGTSPVVSSTAGKGTLVVEYVMETKI